MDIGRLKNRIAWGEYINSQDAAGGLQHILSIKGKLWANVRYLTGSNLLEGNVELDRELISVVCRYNQNITNDCVLIIANKNFKIESIAPDTDFIFMTISAENIK